MQGEEGEPFPSPSPNPSHLLRDISNYKTPKPSSQNPNPNSPFPIFFTASKQTPLPPSSSSSTSNFSSFRRRQSSVIPLSRSKAARRLKAFELEQSQSARKVQIRRDKSLKSLSKSLTVWLNFLFENPRSCGCDFTIWNGGSEGAEQVSANGKRDSWPGGSLGIDRAWRSPKRQREGSWRASDVEFSSSAFTSLQISLRDVCSFEDLKERMGAYLSVKNGNEVLSVMSQVAKNIDEGRLRMKAHCPLVTDVGLKEKATRVLLCYNPTWLRIGLHIVFGGDLLLPIEDNDFDRDDLFLKMIIEKQFFSHAGLAKAYAYNKLVEGVYRPGYFEALGNVILKRFLLLVLLLDKAKCQSRLPVKYGIDGIDGGSPLLFSCRSYIKSSRQLIHEFLSEVMHGEGDLLAHLVMVGYKVSYQQFPLAEYDFSVTDLFDDLNDGVRLCRAVQLLQCNASILTKLVLPSDTHKKNLMNCGVAMQYLKQAGMPLSDEDGVLIVADDVANGDKELTLSLLWNMFVYLQLPLLINKSLLAEEIYKVKGSYVDLSKSNGNLMDMLLEWIQAICNNYHLTVDNFSSLIDGKALCCLVDYYFRNELLGHSSPMEALDTNGEGFITLSNAGTTVTLHSFILIQRVTTMLGNFPEVLQISDILEHGAACNERSVIILLIFLSSQLIGRKDLDRLNIHKLMGWNYRSPELKSSATVKPLHFTRNGALLNMNSSPEKDAPNSVTLKNGDKLDEDQAEGAALVIQSHFRGLIERRSYLRIKTATSFLQTIIRGWLTVTGKNTSNKFGRSAFLQQLSAESRKSSDASERYMEFMIERRQFLRIQESVLLIQSYIRRWIVRSRYVSMIDNLRKCKVIYEEQKALERNSKAAIKIQLAWRNFTEQKFLSNQCSAAIKIQSHWRSYVIRRDFLFQRKTIIKIQSGLRCQRCLKAFKQCKLAAIKIQQLARGQIARKRLLGSSKHCSSSLHRGFLDPISGMNIQSYELKILLHSVLKLQRWWTRVLLRNSRTSSAIIIQSHFRGWVARCEAYRMRHHIAVIQSHWRGWLIRRDFLHQREAVIKIQSVLQSVKCCESFKQCRQAVVEIQRFARGQIVRKRLLGSSSLRSDIRFGFRNQSGMSCTQNLEMKILLHSVSKLQRWWKRVLLLRSKEDSAIIIQSHVRGWIARRKASRERHRVVVIQSYWKGYLARKGSRKQLEDLRSRVKKSSANVDNSKRLMSRLVAALSELLSKKSVRSILYTCATLDMATEHSQKCCETLVSAGAIETLLKLIPSLNRNIPDQEVLRHALSTLRNLVRYPHLAGVLINTHGSVEVIFREMLRNKEEGYFISLELLQKLCATQKGIDAIRKLPSHVKRLCNLAEDLERRASMEKRNARLPVAAKDYTERRFRAAVELLQLITKQ
ncbi:binding / calmodulin binding protein isoform X2 [Tasmannia lanceolata]|uniref:binding / calmodulin binding protein isoform X2 n=1 Tax=Tasmannia lanceolata TaxID=3420 RepID=UPI004063D0DC